MTDGNIAISVKAFCERLQIGKTVAYRLINDKAVETIQIGRRRLVLVQSINDFVDRRRGQGEAL